VIRLLLFPPPNNQLRKPPIQPKAILKSHLPRIGYLTC